MLEATLALIKEHDLGECVKWIMENNPSQSLPYHNLNHSMWVMFYVDKIWKHEQLNKKYEKIPFELLVAALFHDFGHSGGFFWIGKDNKNIEIAHQGFHRWLAHRLTPANHTPGWAIWHECDHQLVDSLIRYSEFPHKELNGKADHTDYFKFLINALRDADFMQRTASVMIIDNLTSIREEYFRYTDWKEYLKKSIEFLHSIDFRTTYGQVHGEEDKKKAIGQLTTFTNLTFGTS